MPNSSIKEDEIMVAFKLKKDLYNKVKELTATYSCSVSAVIRFILQDYIKRNIKEN